MQKDSGGAGSPRQTHKDLHAGNLSRRLVVSALAFAIAGCVTQGAAAGAGGEVRVMISGGFSQAYAALTPRFEKARGDKLVTAYGPSMGDSPTAIPSRLSRGERADVVILAREGLDALVAKGLVVKGSEVDLVRSRVAVAVKAGAPVPDISTVEGLKRALLSAKSIAYSDSASGVYVSNELFRKLGVEDAVRAKSRKIQATPVAEVVARGEAEIGFQQLSELLPVAGVTVVGPIPESVQKVTVFSAGVPANAPSPAEGRALIDFLSSPQARAAIEKTGLQAIPRGAAR